MTVVPPLREIYIPNAPERYGYAVGFDFGSHLVLVKDSYFITCAAAERYARALGKSPSGIPYEAVRIVRERKEL